MVFILDNDIDDSFIGMKSAKKKFIKLFPQEEINFISTGAVCRRIGDKKVSRVTSPFFHTKGIAIISDNRIFPI